MERSSDHGDVDHPTTGVPPTSLPAADGLFGSDPLGRALERWAAEASVDEAARRRARQRWLRVQAEEEATVAGVLLDLAEQARPLVVDVAGGRVRGTVVGLGSDFVALRSDQGRYVLARLDGIEVVRPEPGAGDVRGDRSVVVDVGLASVMGPLAGDRPEVHVRTRSGSTVRGRLVSAGVDVVRIRTDADPPTPTWVPLATVALVVVDG